MGGILCSRLWVHMCTLVMTPNGQEIMLRRCFAGAQCGTPGQVQWKHLYLRAKLKTHTVDCLNTWAKTGNVGQRRVVVRNDLLR